MLFKILCISHRWFEIDFNRMIVLTNSYYLGCDAPAFLLEALGNLFENKASEQWLCWQDEPEAYILKLERNDNKLIIEIYDTDQESSDLEYRGISLAKNATKLLYGFDEEIIKALEAIITEFSLYENGNGNKIYLSNWGNFLQKEYDRIKEIYQKNK